MPKKHANIPIFIPHLGCPHTCVFCNQRSISGVKEFDAESVFEQIDTALKTIDPEAYDVEIAFFGGSFTGIDPVLMRRLLEIANSYCKSGRVKGIRLSTRPDYITPAVIEELKKYPITAVELGVQSTSDSVLLATERGHTKADIDAAIALLNEHQIPVVGQMMIGLPTSTDKDEIETANFLIDRGVFAVRIYPTVVFCGTKLQKLTEERAYQPLSLEEAVRRSADAFTLFLNANIPVIRIGLCANDALVSPDTYYAGPNHAAIGELVKGEFFYRQISKELEASAFTDEDHLHLSVPLGATSAVVGQHGCYKKALISKYHFRKITILEEKRPPYTVAVRLTKINKG